MCWRGDVGIIEAVATEYEEQINADMGKIKISPTSCR
jgi:hypothetical protein